jgi:hypothetical protein
MSSATRAAAYGRARGEAVAHRQAQFLKTANFSAISSATALS